MRKFQAPVLPAVALALVILAGPALADPAAAAGHPNASAAAIRQQQQEIRADVTAGKGRYKDLAPDRRAQLLAHQDRVLALLGNVEWTTQLPESDQIAAFNALEAIEAIVNAAEDDRMVCERFKPVGSNRPQTLCRTVAQRRAEREAAQQDVGRRDRTCFKNQAGECL